MREPAAPARSADAPAYVQVFPTLRCDGGCAFCFNRGIPPAGDMAPADLERVLDRLRAAGVTAVDFLGGEPTLHPRLGDLVAAVAARGMRATLSTNGRGRLDLLERIEDDVGRERLRVGVSVGTAPVSPGLAAYARRRAPVLKSVCTSGWRLPAVAGEHLGRGGEFYLIFEDAVRPADLRRTLSFHAYRRRLGELRRRHRAAGGVWCEGFVPNGADAPLPRPARCPAGTTKLSVAPDGSVYPCYLLFSRPEYRLGSLVRDSFERIWSSPALDFFRRSGPRPCPEGDCEHHDACRGGCPAVALLAAGDRGAPDPRCVRPRETFRRAGASNQAGTRGDTGVMGSPGRS